MPVLHMEDTGKQVIHKSVVAKMDIRCQMFTGSWKQFASSTVSSFVLLLWLKWCYFDALKFCLNVTIYDQLLMCHSEFTIIVFKITQCK